MSGSMQGIWGTFCCTLQVLPSLFIEGEKGGDYFGKHEMEKNFKTSVRDQCDCHGGTAMVLI